MKYTTLFATVLIISTTASAQRFATRVGVNGGAAGTIFQNEYYKLWNNNATLEEHPKNALSNIQYVPNFGLSLSLYNPEKRDWFGSVGLQFNSFKQSFNNKSDSASWSSFLYERTSVARLNYVQVPIQIGYMLKFNKVKPYLSIGVAPAYLVSFKKESSLGYDGATMYESATKKGIDAKSSLIFGGGESVPYGKDGYIYKKFNIFYQTSLGVNIELSSKLEVNIAANYQQSMSSIENHNALKTKGYYFGSDYYSAHGLDKDDVIIYLKNQTMAQLEKPNKFDTKLAAIGINLGINLTL